MTTKTLSQDRMYEIADLEPDHIWDTPWNDTYDIRGTVIQPASGYSETWRFVIRRHNERKFPSLFNICIAPRGMRLRPLTQAEMEKINATPSQDRPTD